MYVNSCFYVANFNMEHANKAHATHALYCIHTVMDSGIQVVSRVYFRKSDKGG